MTELKVEMNKTMQEFEEDMKGKVIFSTDCTAQERAVIMNMFMASEDEKKIEYEDVPRQVPIHEDEDVDVNVANDEEYDDNGTKEK